MAAWPTTLPGVQGPGYVIKPADTTVRTDMEAGAARSRRLSSARNDKIPVAWIMTDGQLAIFRTWFDDPAQANGGAAWFTTRLSIGTGGVVVVDARFVGPWQSANQGGMVWVVSAELEIR